MRLKILKGIYCMLIGKSNGSSFRVSMTLGVAKVDVVLCGL